MNRMKPATHESLDPEQAKFKSQLAQAVEHINEADDLLARNTNSEAAANRATALLLSAVARVLVLETGEKWNLSRRLPAFKHPK
jgi:transcription elongation GreA/GreB family factor